MNICSPQEHALYAFPHSPLLILASDDQALRVVIANLENCQARFDAYPQGRTYCQVTTAELSSPISVQLADLPEMKRLLQTVPKLPGSEVKLQTRLGVLLFYGEQAKGLLEPLKAKSFKGGVTGLDGRAGYGTQFSTHLKEELLPISENLLRQEGFSSEGPGQERDTVVLRSDGVKYTITRSASGEERVSQTGGVPICLRRANRSRVGPHSHADLYIVGAEGLGLLSIIGYIWNLWVGNGLM